MNKVGIFLYVIISLLILVYQVSVKHKPFEFVMVYIGLNIWALLILLIGSI